MRASLAAALLLAALAAPAAAAPPTAPPGAIDVTKVQPKALLPKRALHSEFVVEVNRLGQISRVKRANPSHDPTFDAQTYGNALQSFIRTPDGRAIPGVYSLSYDYSPKTARVRRDVRLLHPGGVNPNAKGAANDMIEIARRNAARATPAPGVVPNPRVNGRTVDTRRMPDLPQVMKTPHPGT